MKHANLKTMSIADIQLDKDNPRIKQYLEYYTEISSEMLALALSDSSNGDSSTTYRSLRESIKASGGIIHPIVVNHNSETGDYVVIEGNTRLQIYKEFLENDPTGPWNNIVCLIYEDLSEYEKHEIRLQSHLVGPREWDPYSKAKYLYQLSYEEHMTMNTIIDMCGGGKNEIQRAIDAYLDMERFYRPYAQSKGLEFNSKDFSKFREYQNGVIRHSLISRGYAEDQFAKWVADGKIDNAQKVRSLPRVMKDPEATAVLKRRGLIAAEKVLNAKELQDADLTKYPYETLARTLILKLSDIKLSEVQALATEESYADKKGVLESLQEHLAFVIDEIKSKE